MEEVNTSKIKTAVPMKIFEDLASVSDKKRVVAVEKLANYFENETIEKDQTNADTAYTIKRLIRGLASNRKLARVGFATAMSNCLEKGSVSLDASLGSLSDPTSGGQFLMTSGNMGKADRTHILIGQLFFVAAIVKSMTSLADVDSQELSKLVTLCVEVFRQKPVLRQMACSVLGHLTSAIAKIEEHAKAVFKAVQRLLKLGWPSSSSDIDAADTLLLALVCEPVVPTSFWSDSGWIAEAAGEKHSQRLFAQSLLSDPRKVAAVIVSARQTPVVHLSAVKLCEQLSLKLHRRKVQKCFAQFWSELVDERLLLPASALSHKTAALQLGLVALTKFVKNQPNLVPVILSQSMTKFLSSSLRRRLSHEHSLVVAFFSDLLNALSATKSKSAPNENDNTSDYYFAILMCLMRPPLCVWREFPSQFDRLLSTCPVETIANLTETMKSIVSNASFEFNYGYESGQGEIDSHCWKDPTASFGARRWAVSHLATFLSSSSSVGQPVSDTTSVLYTIFESCLFFDEIATNEAKQVGDEENSNKEHNSSKKIGLLPRDQAVNVALRGVGAATSSVPVRPISECISIMKSVLSSVKHRLLEGNDSCCPLVVPLSEDCTTAFLSLVKVSKKKTVQNSVAELLRLFACHAAVLLLCYPTDKDIIQLAHELNDLFQSVSKTSSENDEEGPPRVFLDMLIGLLSRKSRPLRQLTTNMFAKLISNRVILKMLISTSNADSDSQSSSLVDLVVNALLGTQFVEDSKERDDDTESDGDKDDDDSGKGENAGDESDGKLKRKRTLSGHLVVSTAAPNDNDADDNSSVDSVLLDDEEMFKLDHVFASAVKANAGPAKRMKREKRNQLQEMKEFHMKLLHWLELLIHQAEQMTKNEEECATDGNCILVDVIGVLLNTLANKKKTCSVDVERRLCHLVKAVVLRYRQAKATEAETMFKNLGNVLLGPFSTKSGVASGEFILDSALQIVRNMSASNDKLDAAATTVELLLLCADVSESFTIKPKFILAAIKNSFDEYLAHPSPHGHVFFMALLSSTKLSLKQMERLFFDRLTTCLEGGKQSAEADEDGNSKTDSKVKSFPRSQSARLLANSQLVTSHAYTSRPKICDHLGCILNKIIQSFVDESQSAESDELIKCSKKSIQQPWLYRNVVDLARRHVLAVLANTSTHQEKLDAIAGLSAMSANIEFIRDRLTGKKFAEVRAACSATLRVLKRYEKTEKSDKKPSSNSVGVTAAKPGEKRKSKDGSLEKRTAVSDEKPTKKPKQIRQKYA